LSERPAGVALDQYTPGQRAEESPQQRRLGQRDLGAVGMQLRFLGGTGHVSGSKVLVEHDGRRLLVDCGLFQGLKQLRARNWAPLPLPMSSIAAVVLTHARLEHCGYLPRLVELGFRGKVYTTAATAELCRVLLADAGRQQEEDARSANHLGYSRHVPARALFTEAQARRSLQRLQVREFETAFEPVPGFELTLRRAGHVPGAASVRLRCADHTLLFSGALGRYDDALTLDPASGEDAQHVLLDSACGQRSPAVADPIGRLAEIIRRTAARGGVVLIPACITGDAPRLLHVLLQLKSLSKIPDMPIHLDSPLAGEVLAVYGRHCGELRIGAEQIDAMVQSTGLGAGNGSSVAAQSLPSEPAIVIAPNSMATGGRVLHHLKACAGDARHTIVLPGLQAAGTRGAALLAGSAQIKVHGQWVPVRAEVAGIDSLCARADHSDLLRWLFAMRGAPQHVYLMHGEPEAADRLRQAITERRPWNCSVPEYLDLVNF
jgi:metallo-beta-lactamase family protein